MGLTYVDSCVILDALTNPEPRGVAARRAIESQGSDQLVTSPLVEMECMVRPLRAGDQQLIAFMRQALSRFRRVDVPGRAFELGAHMRAIHGLKTADAVHVATASLSHCSAIWTSDVRLLTALPGFATEPAPEH